MPTLFSELPHTLEEDNALAWQYPLSSNVPDASLALYDKRLMRAAHVVGFGGIVVRGYIGELTTYDIGAVKIAEAYDGAAAGAGVVAEVRAKTEEASLVPDGILARNCQWPIAYLYLNRNELASRAATRIQDGIPQAKAWANELDGSLHRAFNKAAWKKLQTDLWREADGEPWITAMITGLPALAFVDSYGSAIALYGFAHYMRTTIDIAVNKAKTGEHGMNQRRWSLFPWVAQPDRFAAGVGMLSMQRLVRPTS